MSIRFVVCIDIDEDDLHKAYEKLWKAMNTAQQTHDFWEGFESTDEAFLTHHNGAAVDPAELQAARMAFFAKASSSKVGRSSGYLYDSAADCEASGSHLESCDDDGYCNLCGEQ